MYFVDSFHYHSSCFALFTYNFSSYNKRVRATEWPICFRRSNPIAYVLVFIFIWIIKCRYFEWTFEFPAAFLSVFIINTIRYLENLGTTLKVTDNCYILKVSISHSLVKWKIRFFSIPRSWNIMKGLSSQGRTWVILMWQQTNRKKVNSYTWTKCVSV